MKGKNFLKVTGILMIIGGAISAIVGLIALIGTLALSSLLTGSGLLGWMIIGSVFCLLSGVAELIAGIFGVSHCEKPEKAHTCLLWGCIVVGLCVLGNIFNVIGGSSVSVVSLLLGLVIPALYIYGAVQNKNSAA